jgi:hypothetical protein
MMDRLLQFLLSLSQNVGDPWFLIITLIASAVLCFLLIPLVTSKMVGSASGLAGKYLGREKRTLIINASTNNPELFMMLVSLAIVKLGGIATPLGSNLANIYLMLLVAPVWVVLTWLFTGNREKRQQFGQLLKKEKGLVMWHVLISVMLFGCATVAMRCLTDTNEAGEPVAPALKWLLLGGGACVLGIAAFFFFEGGLKRRRPELFQDISDEGENASWVTFIVATIGLMICSGAMNVIFLAWTEVYSTALVAVLGASVFTGLHYFVGALVTSLPEVTVAIINLARLRSSDLNTALGSASYSNMSNLGIAAIGTIIAVIMILFGVKLGA